ncbi:hypothetical protein Leryth_004950 [Lithospermum erythrorhizon]|nr:hypothetical protein Leryth_004950 [Lithospermum erythrorhizon]
MQINGDSTPRPNPTVHIPHFDHHQDPTAHNHFLLTSDNNLMLPETLTNLQRYLPSNNISDDFDIPTDSFSSDHFRMFEFKIRKCTRGRPHDWTECPFAHSGEKARRRDPRKFHYSGNPCPEYRRGFCCRGDTCEYAHGVFECWLHPSKYRTLPCKDGAYCKRRACFFAHAPRSFVSSRAPPEVANGFSGGERRSGRVARPVHEVELH